MDFREQIALRALTKKQTLEAIAKEYGTTFPTVRLWRERYRAEGRLGLVDRSTAPHTCPLRTSKEIEALIVAERVKYRWGAKKIRQRLIEAHPELVIPQASTIDSIIARHGLPREKRHRRIRGRSPFVRRYEAAESFDLLTMDFKGQFRMRNQAYCFPLTVCDSFSRFILACEALPDTSLGGAWPVIERVFRKHGLPYAMQADHGVPFGAPNGKFSSCSVRLMKLGVQPIFSRPGKPTDNARHERMHRDLKREVSRDPGKNLRHQQRLHDEFVQRFNFERPHESLDMQRPSSVFRPSPRPFPSRPRKPEYAGHLEIRKVSNHGSIKWRNVELFISAAFAGEPVALEPLPNATLGVHFYEFIIGVIDEESTTFS